MLAVVDKCAQACQGALLVFGLVAGLGTLDEYLLCLAGIGIAPVVAQAHTRLDLVDVLTAGATRAEGVPLDLALVDFHLKGVGLGQHGHRGGRGVYAALGLGGGHTLHAVHAALVLEHAVDARAAHRDDNLLEAAGRAGALRCDGGGPAAALAVAQIHLGQVAGKEGGFVAACAGAYLEDYVFVVFGVDREQ